MIPSQPATAMTASARRTLIAPRDSGGTAVRTRGQHRRPRRRVSRTTPRAPGSGHPRSAPASRTPLHADPATMTPYGSAAGHPRSAPASRTPLHADPATLTAPRPGGRVRDDARPARPRPRGAPDAPPRRRRDAGRDRARARRPLPRGPRDARSRARPPRGRAAPGEPRRNHDHALVRLVPLG